MRFLFIIPLFVSQISHAQTINFSITEEIKRTKKNSDYKIVGSDKSGVYYVEVWQNGHAATGFGKDFDYGARLIKIQDNFQTIYSKDYSNELKNLSFDQIIMQNKIIYIFAKKYVNKTNLYHFYAAKIDNLTGELVEEFVEYGTATVSSLQNPVNTFFYSFEAGFLKIINESGSGDGTFQCVYTNDKVNYSQSFTLKIPGKSKVDWVLDASQVDEKNILFQLTFNRESTKNKNGKGSKEAEFWMFDLTKKSYLKIAGDNTHQIAGAAEMIHNKTGQLMVYGFCSSPTQSPNMLHYCIQKLDLQSKKLVFINELEVNTNIISKEMLEKDDKGTKSFFDKDIMKDINKYFEEYKSNNLSSDISIISSPTDSSTTIVLEMNQHLTKFGGYSTYSVPDRFSRTSATYYHYYITNQLAIIHTDKSGKILWSRVIPKTQLEKTDSGNPVGGIMWMLQFPHYSSIKCNTDGNNLYIIFNDHKDNNENGISEKQLKPVYDFTNESKLYLITVDLVNGNSKRKEVFTNNKETILFPRFSYPSDNNEFLIPVPDIFEMKKNIDFRIARLEIK